MCQRQGTQPVIFGVVLLTFLMSAYAALAKEARYLSLRGPGTASVFWAEGEPTAYITDGGKGLGIAASEIGVGTEPSNVLNFLLKQGVRNLVITCSHPHSDHMDGLVRLIRDDPRIFEFANLFFVDSHYPAKETLLQVYERRLKEVNPKVVPHHERVSATGQDAYAIIAKRLNLPADRMIRVSNFAYQPRMGSGAHGHCVITHYTLTKGGNRCVVVDFDDANDDLVRSWADAHPTGPRPDVIILPHHGSSGTDIRPLLVEHLRPRAFVVTVNPENQYMHPGPENTLLCIQAVGRENVHFTGTGRNVEITECGLQPMADAARHAANYDRFFRPQLGRLRNRLFEIEEALSGEPLNQDLLTRRYELRRREQAVSTLRELLTRTEPPTVATLPPPLGPNDRLAPLNLAPRVPKDPPKEPDAGAYLEQARNRRDYVPPGLTRHEAFEHLQRISPLRPGAGGGIVLGNRPASPPKVLSAEFQRSHDKFGRLTKVVIVVRVDGEKGVFTYDEVTPTELWAAYNFLRPSPKLMSAGARKGDVVLVSIAKNNAAAAIDDSWEFAIHPAIAGTLLAREAMRLDMVLAMRDPSLPESVPFQTYRWYDCPAAISVREGSVLVTGSPELNHCLMRVKLWNDKEIDHDMLPTVRVLYDRFDALRNIDRFAKLVAVLGWIEADNYLPSLPEDVQPRHLHVPAKWHFSAVHADPRVIAGELKQQVKWSHAFDLAVREVGQAEFNRDTQKFGVEAFKDNNTGLGLYISQIGSLACVPAFQGDLPPKAEFKNPKVITGLELKCRKAGQKEFTRKTKVHSLEVFRDPNVGTWIYVTEKGELAATGVIANPDGGNKAPTWVHGLELSVRKSGISELKDAAKYGIEVYRDGNTGNLIYICETGALAVIPESTEVKGEGKAPDLLHGLDLACRKHNEPSITTHTRKFGIEVYRDGTTDTLLFISETGNIAVTPAPKKVNVPTTRVKDPRWTHGLNMMCRNSGEKEFAINTRMFGAEVYLDENVGVILYIGETGAIAATLMR